MTGLIPTRTRFPVPRGLSYPLGAEAISKGLQSVPQFQGLRAIFYNSTTAPQVLAATRAGDPILVLSVEYSNLPVTISAEDRPFFGDIDEVRVSGGVEPLVYRISDLEHIVGWKKILHFDRRGHLDPSFHSSDVRIVVVETPDEAPGAKSKTDIHTDYSLTFEEWLARWDSPPPLHEDEEELRLEAGFGLARKVAIDVDRLGVIR